MNFKVRLKKREQPIRNNKYRKSSITTAPSNRAAPSNTAAAVLYLYSITTAPSNRAAPLKAQSEVLFIYSITTAPSNRAAAVVLEFRIEPRRL